MSEFLQRDPDGPTLEADQSAVVEAYHEGSGRVVVGAGAGTGKTTTLMDVVAEAVLQELFTDVPEDTDIDDWLENNTSDALSNPFDEILLTTFSNDAANELKARLKRRLREHDRFVSYSLPVNVWSWIETGSTISTIDAFFHELFTEIAPELGISPDFEVQSELELQTLREEIMYDLRTNHRELVQRLEGAYPAENWREYPPDDLETMLSNAQQRCREYCITPREAANSLIENLNRGHAGVTPPYDLADINDIVSETVHDGATVRPPDADSEAALVAHAEETYTRSKALAEDFGTLLVKYDALYDEYTREEEQFSHMDITHFLYRFLEENPDHPFTEALGMRYQHVFVDEFQDTSYAQSEVLSEFITDGTNPTNYLLIGDVKQSIYEWRSAEPAIFGQLIEHASDVADHSTLPLAANELVHRPLSSNFRSHPHIIGVINEVFSDIFSDAGRGAIGDVPIDYTPLHARRPTTESETAHIHVLNRGGTGKTEEWITDESRHAAETVAGILDHGEQLVDREPFSSDMTLEEPTPGDITFLFRRRRFIRTYADALRDQGIGVAVNLDDDLFSQTEVKLIVDLLDWFANPHSKASLLRIVRSPMVAVSDSAIRALVAHGSSIPDLLDEWPDHLPADDQTRLANLVTLRDDLRWEREGSKTELIHRIYRHSGFDTVVLADTGALRRYGNLWLLTEVVSQWEDEELLAYREFVDRLQRLREQSDSDGESDYTVVRLADEADTETVTLTTIHAAKGREFPIVFAVDLIHRLNYPRPQLARLLSKRTEGFALRPRAAERPCPRNCKIPTPDEDARVWLSEDFDGNFPDCTGPIWLSDARERSSGELQYPNPLNEYIKPQVAESWRMLYVALTRATDHLFIGLGETTPYKGEWTTWMQGVRESLSNNGKWSSGMTQSLVTAPGETNPDDRQQDVPFGVDDVEPGTRRTRSQPDTDGIDVFLDSTGPESAVESIPFIPDTITPTSIHTLAECPRRYQYRHVQHVTDVRHPSRSELTSPGAMDAARWGTLAHSGLERFITDGKDAALATFEDDDSARTAFEHGILSTFRSSMIWDQVDTYCEEDDVLTEHEVRAFVDIDGVETQVRGKADLLYRSGTDWHVVDFKTASKTDVSDYRAQKHRRQVLAYSWLLKAVYGVSVSSQTIYYLGDGAAVEYADDPDSFLALLDDAMDRVAFDDTGNLHADPDTGSGADLDPASRCGSCPYSAARGGPCEYGGDT